MDLNPNVWIPHYWFFLKTTAFNYPIHPNAVTKKKYYEFIMNFPLFIPHTKTSNDFCELLDKYPLRPYLDSRNALTKWVHFIHNRYNETLNIPIVKYEDYVKEYFDLYRENHNISKNKGLFFGIKIKDYAYFAIFLILCIFIYYTKKYNNAF